MSTPAARRARERWLSQQMANKRRHRRIFRRRVVAQADAVVPPHLFELPGLPSVDIARATFRALPWWLRTYLWLTGRAPR